MTLADARPAGPRHARLEPTGPAERVTAPPRHRRTLDGWATTAAGPGTPVIVPAPRAAEPPAGLGPWVPPLPAPEPILSRAVWAWIGTVVVALVLGTTVLVTMGLRGGVPAAEATYLASVRANSSLTSADVTDDELVTDGRGVCSALDAHPSRSALLGAFATLTRQTGWSADDTAAVVGSAIGAFCPAHRALIGR